MSDEAVGDYQVPEGVTSDSPPPVPVPTPTPEPDQPAEASSGGPVAAPEYSRGAQERIRELANARREAADAAAQARAEVALLQKQIQALTGLTPPVQEDPQEREIRAALEKMYPALGRLNKVPLDKLEDLEARLDQLREGQEAQEKVQQAAFTRMAEDTTTALYEAVKGIYGADPNPAQKQWFHQTFVAWLENSPERTQRYVLNDRKLVGEFVKDYAASVLDPVRRSAAVTVGARAARTAGIPTGGATSSPVGTAPPTLGLDDEDARHDAAWNAIRAKRG